MAYRLYSFVNTYLSSIQKGLQTAHLFGELSSRYTHNYDGKQVDVIFREWAETDKTIIILDGGNHQKLADLRKYLAESEWSGRDNPWAGVEEDYQSLRGATTAAGIILPDWFSKVKFPEQICTDLTKETYYLQNLLSTSKLAV